MSALPAHSSNIDDYPRYSDFLPGGLIEAGPYQMYFARTREDLDAVGRLRFEVFNLELNEGLDASYELGRDEDPFDRICHHLLIRERSAGVVGTYRLQTCEMADEGGLGFYSASEFDFAGLPDSVLAQGVELGRACIARSHRSLKVLYLLWRGIGLYLTHNRRRYVFGCSSLTSQDPAEGYRVYDDFCRHGHVHPVIHMDPLPDYACERPADDPVETVEVPRLMRVYLSLGARVCSLPALDRMFKTIDYFTLFDTQQLSAQAQSYFMPDR